MSRGPLLIVVSAPSGAGKSTLCDLLIASRKDIVYSVSCTTRSPRGQERDGVDYHFLTEDAFERRAVAGEFLEHAVVHDYRYGTLKDTVNDVLAGGDSVLMDIDVQGAEQIRAYVDAAVDDDPVKRAFVDIFVEPPSMDVLRQRLQSRNEDTPEVIEVRLRNAEAEMKHRMRYRHRLVNDDLEQALGRLEALIREEQGCPPSADAPLAG
jgi:guanylate kinase